MNLIVYRFGKESYFKQMNDIREWQNVIADKVLSYF